jgi:hypothetical protein
MHPTCKTDWEASVVLNSALVFGSFVQKQNNRIIFIYQVLADIYPRSDYTTYEVESVAFWTKVIIWRLIIIFSEDFVLRVNVTAL